MITNKLAEDLQQIIQCLKDEQRRIVCAEELTPIADDLVKSFRTCTSSIERLTVDIAKAKSPSRTSMVG